MTRRRTVQVSPSSLQWRKSSRSGNNGACVEVAIAADLVATRDSKDPDGPVLVFSRASWTSFLAGLSE
ncbi:DUF397 domain-containing protein [Saccharopolyspora antimicrobica]|uniref:DUF397 domain-containing protein n=1 Tax=Saccharopolyspora antimicrobica TaxID=455193 RepID=UPI00319DB363